MQRFAFTADDTAVPDAPDLALRVAASAHGVGRQRGRVDLSEPALQPEPTAFPVQVDSSWREAVAGHQRGVGFSAAALRAAAESGAFVVLIEWGIHWRHTCATCAGRLARIFWYRRHRR